MSNYPSTTPWYNPLPAMSPAALGDADVGSLIRRRRIGIFFFWVLAFLAINNLNAVGVMALGRERMFSIPMLIAAVVVLISFQIALIRDMGASGLIYIAFLVMYLAISLPMGIQNFSIDFYIRAHWVRMLLTSLLVIAACARRRHTMLVWSKRRLLHWLFLICMVQVAMIFVGKAFPRLVYADTGPLVEGRFSGFFRNPNEAGMACCATVAVGFAYLTVAKRKMWVVACMLVAAVAVILTFSRSSFFTLFLLVLLQVVISPVIKRKSILLVTILSIIFITWFATVGVFSFIDVNKTQSKRLASLHRILTFQVDVEDDTGHRLDAAGAAYREWIRSPVIGNGFTTMLVLEETGLGPHNSFLLVLGEGGVLPLGLLFLFILVFTYLSWKSKDLAARALGLGVMFVYVCTCMVDHTVLTSRVFATLVGVSMGMFSAIAYRDRLLQGAMYASRMVYQQPVVPPAQTPAYLPPVPQSR